MAASFCSVIRAGLLVLGFVAGLAGTCRPAPAERLCALIRVPEAERADDARLELASRIRRCAAAGASIIVLSDQPAPLERRAGRGGPVLDGDPAIAELAGLARSSRVWIIAQVLEAHPDEPGAAFSATVMFDPAGEVVARCRKQMPPQDPPSWFRRGSARTILDSVDAVGTRVGLATADDLSIAVPRLSLRGADVLFVTANEPPGSADARRGFCQELARRHQVTLVVSDAARGQGDRPGGLTGIYAPGGELPSSRQGGDGSVVLVTLPPPRGEVARVPLGLPSLPIPTDSAISSAWVALGRALFFDPRLSSDGSVSCATCHRPDRAFSNGEAVAHGVHGRSGSRNVPSLLNVAYKPALFADGYACSLENQAKYPISDRAEMNVHYLDVASAIRSIPEYQERFRATGAVRPLRFEDIARALASYQRTLLAADSPFDRYVHGGRPEALDPTARRGLELFRGKARCASCHVVGRHSSLLTDYAFHNTGVGYERGTGLHSDPGLGMISYEGRSGEFMTPSLRNVSETGPYMHDGSLATLEEVIDFYDRGGNPNPDLDSRIRPLDLTAAEKAELVAFLRSLTGRACEADLSSIGRIVEPGGTTRVAAIRMRAVSGGIRENMGRARGLIAAAAARHAGWVVLPEFAFTGPPSELPRAVDTYREELAEVRAMLADAARQNRLIIQASFPETVSPSGYANSLVVFGPTGAILVERRKAAVQPDWGDGRAIPGDPREIRPFRAPGAWVGSLSGDELEAGIPRLAQLGCRLIGVSASWNDREGRDARARSLQLAERHRVRLVVSNLVDSSSGAQADPPFAGGIPDAGGGPIGDDEVILVEAREGVDGLVPGRSPGLPRGLSPVPLPADRGWSEARAEIGRALFFDARLSADGSISCASCHDPRSHFTVRERFARGVAGRTGRHNVPSLLNVGFRPTLRWEADTATLEEQVQHAIQSWAEMDRGAADLVGQMNRDPSYRNLFGPVVGGRPIEFRDVAGCLADYERTLVSGNSPFDRAASGDEAAAMGSSARRGLEIFRGKARCVSCHEIAATPGPALFSDGIAHNTGIGYHPRFDYLGYSGDGLEGNPATRNTFRGRYLTPSLRNVSETGPYMHDGSLATLEEVIDFYDRGGNPNPDLDSRIRPLDLAAAEKADLVAFLRSLTGDHRHDASGRPELPSREEGRTETSPR